MLLCAMLEDPAPDDEAGLFALALEPALPLVAAAFDPAALLGDAGVVAAALEPAAPAAVGGACIPSIEGWPSLPQPVRSSTSGPSATPAPSALVWRMNPRRVSWCCLRSFELITASSRAESIPE